MRTDDLSARAALLQSDRPSIRTAAANDVVFPFLDINAQPALSQSVPPTVRMRGTEAPRVTMMSNVTPAAMAADLAPRRSSKDLRLICVSDLLAHLSGSGHPCPPGQPDNQATQGCLVGWFDSLFGSTPGSANKLFARFKRKSRAPTDPDLLRIAKDRKGHISWKAVHAEYNRLVLEKYAQDKA